MDGFPVGSAESDVVGCVGMAAVDTLLFSVAPAFEHDAVNVVDRVVVSAGGKGVVTAAAVAVMGGNVLPLALVGRESEVPGLLPAGIDRRYLLPFLKGDVGTWICVSGDQAVVTFVVRREVDPSFLQDVRSDVGRFMAEVDVLYLSLEAPVVMRAALDEAVSRGLPIVSNLSWPLLQVAAGMPGFLRDLVGASTILLMNASESRQALQLLGRPTWPELEALALREVVVTNGAAGGAFAESPFTSWGGYEAHVPRRVACVVGAGDTFNGGYLVSRLRGATVSEACNAAAALAAVSVGTDGSLLTSGASTTDEREDLDQARG